MGISGEVATHYKLLCTTMMDAFGAADMSGRYLEANQVFLDLVGFEKEELLEKSLYDLTPEKWHALEHQIIDEQVLVRGYSDVFQKEFCRKDGAIVPVELRIVLTRDSDHQPIGIWAIVRDITERIAREEKLRRFQHSVESSPDAVFWMNAEGRFPYVNAQACRSLGYSREELMQLHLWDIDADFSREQWGPHWKAVGQAGGAHLERRHRRKDGTLFPVEISSSQVVLNRQKHHVAFVRDISERVRANEERDRLEAQLLQSQKLESVGRLAGGVAHDYNNMLSVILGYSELMRSKIAPDDPLLKDLDQIQQAAQRSRNITQQLLAFSRRQVFEPRILDLNDLVQRFEGHLARLIGEDIELDFMPSPDAGQIEFDPTQIEQILMNLAVNARDAMPDGGKLTIETSHVVLDEAYCREHVGFIPGRFVRLSISDNGIGMGAETVNRIFEPFFTTKDVGQGTGLGLAMVYGIVKQGGGFINVYSEPGQGTTFKIYLPRTTGEAEAPAATKAPLPSSGSETILLVEDDKMVRGMTEAVLRRLGFKVICADGPEEAIDIFKQAQAVIDLLLTDVVMPKMNGRELHVRLKALCPDLKALFMSGYTTNVIVHHGVLDKGVHFISKPFSISKLTAKIRETLAAG